MLPQEALSFQSVGNVEPVKTREGFVTLLHLTRPSCQWIRQVLCIYANTHLAYWLERVPELQCQRKV